MLRFKISSKEKSCFHFPPRKNPFVIQCQHCQRVNIVSPVPIVDHGIHANHDISSISDRHIQTDWTTPKLEKVSQHTRCKTCRNEVYTRVEGKVSKNGIPLAIFCCFFVNCFLCVLTLYLDGFKVYRHFCPSCKAFIGKYRPPMSTGIKVLLVFLTLLCVGLNIFVLSLFRGTPAWDQLFCRWPKI